MRCIVDAGEAIALIDGTELAGASLAASATDRWSSAASATDASATSVSSVAADSPRATRSEISSLDGTEDVATMPHRALK